MRFNLDSPVMDYVNTLISYVILNLLFLLCCIPVITIGPAVAALYQVTLREANKEYGYLYRTFLRGFKEMFFSALFLSLFFGALLLLVSFSVVFWYSYGGVFSMTAACLLAVLALGITCTMLYGFPLLAGFRNTLRQTIRNAFFMAVVHIGYTAVLVVLEAGTVVLFYLYPAFRIFMLAVGFVFFALCKSFLLSGVFVKYKQENRKRQE